VGSKEANARVGRDGLDPRNFGLRSEELGCNEAGVSNAVSAGASESEQTSVRDRDVC